MIENKNGYTLIELIVVISIVSILATIAIPFVTMLIVKVEARICSANLNTVEKMYTTFLVENDIDHQDSIFNQFLDENFDSICTSCGLVSYDDGKVNCSDSKNKEQPPIEEPPSEEVPWL